MSKPPDKGRHPSQYLNDLEEWGEQQYNPGHWTGGKIPPLFKYARWPVVLLILLMAIVVILASVSAIVSSRGYNRLSSIIQLAIAGVLLIGSLAWFFRHRRNRSKRRH